MITHVIWDYNGTVLDDIDATVASVNEMLKARGLPLTDKQTYTDTFDLPIIEYYNKVGIKVNDMEKLSAEFGKYCDSFSEMTCVFEQFKPTVKKLRKMGIKNVLMSSLYNEFLEKSAKQHKVFYTFDIVIGLLDRNVGAKNETAKQFIKRYNLLPANILFVGDLAADYRMASEVGAHCVLIPNGHNSKQVCLRQGVPVLNNIADILEFISNL